MIDRALEVLAKQLDEALKQRFGSGVSIAALGPVPESDAAAPAPAQPVTLTLVRVEEDRASRTQLATRRRPDDAIEELQPDVKLHLHVLVTAAGNYLGALGYLSAVVGFFQGKPVFDPANTPTLPGGIQKLAVELATLSLEEQNNLWGTLGVRYLPSVLYRVRLVAIQESAISRIVPPVTEVNVTEVVRP